MTNADTKLFQYPTAFPPARQSTTLATFILQDQEYFYLQGAAPVWLTLEETVLQRFGSTASLWLMEKNPIVLSDGLPEDVTLPEGSHTSFHLPNTSHSVSRCDG